MQSKRDGEPGDGRLGVGSRRQRKVERIWELIREKQREIRSLESQLARTDPNELVEPIGTKTETQGET
jgi:hypothetical protein